MDNFMDKLAQRYNAGEMIKANSEADAAEMQNLQEQVEAYEAVLQEMRKLNYKNTELTEKMYSLVDESIEKVRTLQIEASENGANTELISREMSDAVTGALNEALNNMDSTVARTISESLASALAQPTEEIKQQAVATENVGNKVDSLKESSEILYTSVEEVKNAIENVSLASKDISAKLDSILEMGVNSSASSEAAEVSFTPEMVDMIKSVAERADKLAEMVSLLQASSDQNKDTVDELITKVTDFKVVTENIDGNVSDIKGGLEIVNNTINGTKTELDTLINDIKLGLEAVNLNVNDVKNTVEVVGVNTGEVKDGFEAVNTNVESIKGAVDAANANAESIKGALENTNNGISEIRSSIDNISNAGNETKSGVEELNGKADKILTSLENANNSVSFDEESKNYITNIWNSVEATRNAVAAMDNKAEDDSSSDTKAAMVELTADAIEIKTSLKNLKSSSEENKNALKASLDSAIYGLKQDNKEIVEFIQRMNSNITAKQNDPEIERKEEEARQREEENKKAIEERFKMTEDFMHKESVKVYRNVQAVINEKQDQQTAGLEAKVKTNTAGIGQVKVIAIVAAALSGLSLVAQVLSIFGIL